MRQTVEDSGRTWCRRVLLSDDCRTTVGRLSELSEMSELSELSDCRTVGLSEYCRNTVGILSEFTVGLSDRGSEKGIRVYHGAATLFLWRMVLGH